MSLQDINESLEYLPSEEDMEAYSQIRKEESVRLCSLEQALAQREMYFDPYNECTALRNQINNLRSAGVRTPWE